MKISCPHCGQHYEADDNNCGASAICDSCGREFIIGAPRADKVQSLTISRKACKTDYLRYIFWVRLLLMIMLVAMALYQIYDVTRDMDISMRYEDSTLRATTKATQSLVYAIKPMVLMLLALVLKPDFRNEK